jgi:dolichol-phosphate mannosyltransferase
MAIETKIKPDQKARSPHRDIFLVSERIKYLRLSNSGYRLFTVSFNLDFLFLPLLMAQLGCTIWLLKRLSTAPQRVPAIQPIDEDQNTKPIPPVTVVIPTLNEAARLPHCLDGLRGQAMAEVVVVDSNSQDGTPEYVRSQQAEYPAKLRLITDDPLPADWVGRPWALHNGYLNANPDSEWVLGVDADTLPQPGMVAAIVQAAIDGEYDIVSLSPRFILKHPGEQLLQPALLVTLIYRFGATGDRTQFTEDRVMANGQCFLSRKTILDRLGGYDLAKSSFCDDVTLVRAAAQRGAKVGFLNGAELLQVRMYTSMAETWTEWGRSLDLKDAATPLQTWGDFFFLLMVQGLPIPLLILLVVLWPQLSLVGLILAGLNLFLMVIRLALMFGIRVSYTNVGFFFWLSPLFDPIAVLRILISTVNRPKQWRGRIYTQTG